MTLDDARTGLRIVRAGTGPNAGKTGDIAWIARTTDDANDAPWASVRYDGQPWYYRETNVPLHELDPLEGER